MRKKYLSQEKNIQTAGYKYLICLFQEGITATEQVKQWQFDTKETLEKLEQMREVGLAWQTHGDALDSLQRLWTGAWLENNPTSVWVTIYFLC